MSNEPIDLGQVAYEGYLVSCEGKSIRGEVLPPWSEQEARIREHWRAAADAVKMFLELRTTREFQLAMEAANDRPARCADPDCDGSAGHDGPHFQWAPE